MSDIRKYFQCDVSNKKPEIEGFGKHFIYKLNQAENSAIVLVACEEIEFNTAQEKAGLDNKTFIVLEKEEARTLSKSWDS